MKKVVQCITGCDFYDAQVCRCNYQVYHKSSWILSAVCTCGYANLGIIYDQMSFF